MNHQHKNKIHIISACLLFLLFTFNIRAQETTTAMTLDEAIQTALDNSPRLKVAINEIEIMKMEKARSWNIQPTEASYSFGQLNSDTKKDRQLEINQSFGSPVTPFYENSLVKYRVATGETMRNITEKEITAEVKHAWNTLLYQSDLHKLYSEQARLYKEYGHLANLYFQQGEISLLEKTMMEAQSAEIFNNLQIAETELNIAVRRLQAICYSDKIIHPSDTSLQKVSLEGNVHGDLYNEWYDRQISEKEAELKVEKTRFVPEVSVGYLRQDILPLKGLNAFTVGVSVPIWFRPQQAKVKQARLAVENSQTRAMEQKTVLLNKQQELFAVMMQNLRSLRYYEEFGIQQADLLYKTVKLQFEKSSINVIEMIQSLTTAINLKNNYLTALYQYNIAVVEYELYGNEKIAVDSE